MEAVKVLPGTHTTTEATPSTAATTLLQAHVGMQSKEIAFEV
jgi:hypothetical protein